MSLRRALALAALSLSCAAQAGDAPPDRRSVSVDGRGEVYATPDRARVSMSVEVTKPELQAAQAEANRVVRELLAQLRPLGLKDEDIATAGLNIRADYDYANSKRRFLGYHVSRGVEVVVRDLDRIGDVLLKATAVGINNVSDPQLESSKAEALQRDALAKAAANARAKAQVLADALGVKLGPIHTVHSSTEAPPPVPRARFALMAAAPAADASGNEQMGFSAGQIRYGANLDADFDLVAP